MPHCALYQIAIFLFFCWVTLKSCYRNWTHCVSHINTLTVSIHCSSIDSLEILLSRVVKSLIMCKEQPIFLKYTQLWTECPASRKRFSRKKYRMRLFSSFQKTNSKQTSGSVFAEKKNKLRRQYMNWN